jgi:hypothetical protein
MPTIAVPLVASTTSPRVRIPDPFERAALGDPCSSKALRSLLLISLLLIARQGAAGQGVTTPTPQAGVIAAVATDVNAEIKTDSGAIVARTTDPKDRLAAEAKSLRRNLALNRSRALGGEQQALDVWTRLLQELVAAGKLQTTAFDTLKNIPFHRAKLPSNKQIRRIFASIDPGDDSKLAAKIDSANAYSVTLASRRRVWTRGLFPVTSRDDAAAFWRQQSLSTLNWGGLSGGLSSGAAYSELVSPLLHAVRVSAYGVIAAAKDESSTNGANKAALERFVNGGGLINLAISWPVLHVGEPEGGTYDVTLMAVPRVGAAIPVLGGAASPDTSSLIDLGAELHARTVDFFDGVGFFGQVRWGAAGGSTQFYDAIGLRNDPKPFDYSTAGIGLLLGNKVAVLVTTPLTGPKPIRDIGTRISVTAFKGGELKVPKVVVP